MNHVLAKTHDHLLHVSFNRPEQQNRFTLKMLASLGRLLREADDDPSIRAILLTGNGDDFSMGGDVADIVPAWKQGINPIAEGDINPTKLGRRKLTKPLITVVQGGCVSGGLEFALASDICIAADNAHFAFEEVRYATFPFAGGVFRFIRAAGKSDALRYVLTADSFDAQEALRMRLVSAVRPLQEAHDYGFALAKRISNGPPLAFKAILDQIELWTSSGDQAALATAISEVVRLLNTKDCAEAMQAMMQHRAPSFTGA